jgi:hypothetical protein
MPIAMAAIASSATAWVSECLIVALLLLLLLQEAWSPGCADR